MTAKRWEDVTPIWNGPSYEERTLRYASSVKTGYLAGRLITCIDVVDWDNVGGRDILLSAWDACYDGQVFLRRETGTNRDGTPILGGPERIKGVTGYMTVVSDGDSFHLVSASRLRPVIFFYRNTGVPGAPAFGDPIVLELDADWVKGNEILHLARFVDIDGDGKAELVVGTDFWDDYWPNGIEWNEEGYRPYDDRNRWLGGPLRGFLYAFRNIGSPADPILERGRLIMAGSKPLEVYGQLAPTFGDFRNTGSLDVVCGEFLDNLRFAAGEGDGVFGELRDLKAPDGTKVTLDHCIHFPAAVDWNGDGHLDLLVGAEDGYVTFVRNTGECRDGKPLFEQPKRVLTTEPELHAGVLPVPAAFVYGRDGRPDLIVGNSAGELLFYPNEGASGQPAFGPEIMLQAGGQTIRVLAGPTGSIQGPSERKFAYTCPTVADWDHDGRPDVLMSDILGQHVFYKNLSDGRIPDFEEGRFLTFQGQPLRTVWRVRPAVVDWNGDGTLSYVTLDQDGFLASYWQDSITELADKRLLTWTSGSPVAFTEDTGGGLGRMKLCICDWTGNGRHDLLVGTHGRASVPPGPGGQPRHTTGQAAVLFLENVGSNADPVFAQPRPIKYRGAPIALGMHACAPEAIDWVGTGAHDLVIGVEDGSLIWLPRSDLSW